ncbi:MAG: universal stress protein [Treponema sp.]|nr:universal stress protein [Treponema sp.]
MSPFSNILVLLDCSSVDDAVVNEVIRIASCGNVRITLVHVVHSHTLDQDRALREKSGECMSERVRQFAASSVKAEPVFLSGEPETELTRYINAGTYDLVAMATHGHKLFQDVLLGSVSDYLKHTVSVPLLMVRG